MVHTRTLKMSEEILAVKYRLVHSNIIRTRIFIQDKAFQRDNYSHGL